MSTEICIECDAVQKVSKDKRCAVCGGTVLPEPELSKPEEPPKKDK
jgi:rRNA maturation endonuclease Nob1